MKLYIKLEAPFEWVRLNGGRVEAFGEVPTLSDCPLCDEDEMVGVVPGEWVTAHKISLPAKTRKMFQIAVPFALEDSVSEDVEQLHFVCPQWKANQETLVYVTAKQKMQNWQELANEHQLPLDSLIADHSLLPFHNAADCSIALVDDKLTSKQQLLANHKTDGGVCVDPEFIDVWLMGISMTSTVAVNDEQLTQQLIADHPDRDFRHWDFGNKMAHWLEHPIENTYDLFIDQYRPSVRHFSWSSFAVPAGVLIAALLLTFVYDTYRYFALHTEISAIDQEQQQLVSQTFPSLGTVQAGKVRFMMEQAIMRMGGRAQPINLPLMLSEASFVLKRNRVTLGDIVFRDSELILACVLNDFSQVDMLTTQLNARPRIRAALQSSASDDGRIVASYSITAP
jgi:general secretion pathway protein L